MGVVEENVIPVRVGEKRKKYGPKKGAEASKGARQR